MPHRLAISAFLLFAAACAAPAAAADDPAGATVRPAGYVPRSGDATLGRRLFEDSKLSTNGASCATCHANQASFQRSFALPYPHTVAMARDQLQRDPVHLDEMIQACMVMPMAAKPLPWDSRELAALVAYLGVEQRSFIARHRASRKGEPK